MLWFHLITFFLIVYRIEAADLAHPSQIERRRRAQQLFGTLILTNHRRDRLRAEQGSHASVSSLQTGSCKGCTTEKLHLQKFTSWLSSNLFLKITWSRQTLRLKTDGPSVFISWQLLSHASDWVDAVAEQNMWRCFLTEILNLQFDTLWCQIDVWLNHCNTSPTPLHKPSSTGGVWLKDKCTVAQT